MKIIWKVASHNPIGAAKEYMGLSFIQESFPKREDETKEYFKTKKEFGNYEKKTHMFASKIMQEA